MDLRHQGRWHKSLWLPACIEQWPPPYPCGPLVLLGGKHAKGKKEDEILAHVTDSSDQRETSSEAKAGSPRCVLMFSCLTEKCTNPAAMATATTADRGWDLGLRIWITLLGKEPTSRGPGYQPGKYSVDTGNRKSSPYIVTQWRNKNCSVFSRYSVWSLAVQRPFIIFILFHLYVLVLGGGGYPHNLVFRYSILSWQDSKNT